MEIRIRCIYSLVAVDGSHPFYLEMRKNGLAHGVFLKNSNGMDVVVEETALQFKTIGGR